MALRILVHTRNLSIPGGKQSFWIAIKEYLKSDVEYFFYGSQNGEKESVIIFIKRLIFDYYEFHRKIKNGKYDIVHINTSFNLKSYFRDSIFALISTLHKTRTIIYWHGWRWDFEKKIASKFLPYFHLTYGRANAMITLAGEFSDRLISYGFNKPVFQITTVIEDQILNLVDNASYLNSQKKNDGFKMLLLSRIEKSKGIYETIISFQKLQRKFPNIILNIAGSGSEMNNLKTFIKDKDCQNVNLLGWLDGEKKAQALIHSDILVHASYSEGMPISILEAMACGKPVVTTQVGAIKDFFIEGKMGFIAKIKDPIDLKVKIEQLFNNPALMKQIGRYNKKYARSKFSATRVSQRLEKIYTDVIEKTNDKNHH